MGVGGKRFTVWADILYMCNAMKGDSLEVLRPIKGEGGLHLGVSREMTSQWGPASEKMTGEGAGTAWQEIPGLEK